MKDEVGAAFREGGGATDRPETAPGEAPEVGSPGPSPEARRAAKILVRTGLVLFLAVTVGLSLGARLELADSILLAVLLAAVPALAIAQVPLAEAVRLERMSAYWSSIVTLTVLGAASLLVGSRDGGVAALGLTGPAVGSFVAWTVGLAAAGLLVIVVFHAIALRAGLADSDLLTQLLPRTRRERVVFALLSLAAGSGEELAYRGYVIPVLAPLLGVGGAALLSTAVFGVIHAYQGPLGIVRTALMGGVLAWGFLASGSLWPPMAAHALIDIVAGIGLGDRLLVDRSARSGTTPPQPH